MALRVNVHDAGVGAGSRRVPSQYLGGDSRSWPHPLCFATCLRGQIFSSVLFEHEIVN